MSDAFGFSTGRNETITLFCDNDKCQSSADGMKNKKRAAVQVTDWGGEIIGGIKMLILQGAVPIGWYISNGTLVCSDCRHANSKAQTPIEAVTKFVASMPDALKNAKAARELADDTGRMTLDAIIGLMETLQPYGELLTDKKEKK